MPQAMPEIEPADVLEAAEDLAADLQETAGDDEATARAVADFLDALIPLDLLLPGLPGIAAEAADGPALEKLVAFLISALRVDPEKRAERKARRQAKRAERRQRRSQRKGV